MMDPKSQIREVKRIFTRVAPVYDLLNHVLSCGEDIRWRRFTARAVRMAKTGRILDVACGTGDLVMALSAKPEKPLVIGLDLVRPMLGPARVKIQKASARAHLLTGDAMALPFADHSFDAVTIAFGIRNIPARISAMREMRRVLAPGGRLYVLEFTTPKSPWVRGMYRLYLENILPKLGGLISGDESSYRYLARTILHFPAPKEFRSEMERAGFIATRSLPLTHGIAWLHVGERPGR